jgi:hypothetical protein
MDAWIKVVIALAALQGLWSWLEPMIDRLLAGV